jgi:hypothetical protein
MRIKCSLVLAAAILSGCAGDGGGGSSMKGTDEPSFRDPDATGGNPIKVSYVRFNEEQDLNTRAVKFVHHYRYMLSQGWRNRKGPRALEPFERIWRDIYKAEEVPDNVMGELVRRMMAAGFGDLKETPIDRINLESLKRIEKMNDRATGQRTRYISVETGSMKKTASYEDNDDSHMGPKGRIKGPLVEKFLAVEQEMLSVMSAYTVMSSVETDSTMPRGKR